MSEQNQDPTRCHVFGCPCLGAIASSTSGTNRWMCGYHHGRDAVAWPKITTHLQRLSYIVAAIEKIDLHRNAAEWPDVYRGIAQEFVSNMRRDLLPASGERIAMWRHRLDAELSNAVRSSRPPVELPLQQPSAQATHTFQKVSFPDPSPA